MTIEQLQKEICKKYAAQFTPLNLNLKLGISDDFLSGKLPLNGLRHPPENGTCGWFLWAGEDLSTDKNYFKPLHTVHLIEKCPSILKFLGLPPGWRFLVAGDYEDVWFDEKLFEI